jgi:hypothetical protein
MVAVCFPVKMSMDWEDKPEVTLQVISQFIQNKLMEGHENQPTKLDSRHPVPQKHKMN